VTFEVIGYEYGNRKWRFNRLKPEAEVDSCVQQGQGRNDQQMHTRRVAGPFQRSRRPFFCAWSAGAGFQKKAKKMSESILSDFIDQHELADQFNVSVRTVYRWLKMREAPPHSRVGRKYYFNRDSARAWLLAKETKPTKRK
jgi:excisionase family DNA binding protein